MSTHGPEDPELVPLDPTPSPDARVDESEGVGAGPGLARSGPRSVSEQHLKGVIESLVFVSEKPITVQQLAEVARAESRDIRRLLHELRAEYQSRGIHLDEIAGAWQLRSSAANAPFVRELLQAKPVKLSRAQVETLSIVAYRQPITRPELDEVRGVDSGSALKILLERSLVRMIGRRDEPGRPMLFGTTTTFLEFFGLRALRDLPMLREFTELSPESQVTLAAELSGTSPSGTPAPTPDGSVEAAPETATISVRPAETD